MSQKERDASVQRAKDRVLMNAKETDRCTGDILQIYADAAAQLEKEIQAMYQKYAGDNGLTAAEASRLLSGDEYSRWRKSIDRYVAEARGSSRTLLELNTLSAKSRISRKEQLLAGIYRTMIDMAGDVEERMEDFLGGLYVSNYYRGHYDVQSLLGIGFSVAELDRKQIRRILDYPWSGKNFSQSVWENTDKLAALARREIALGFISGSSVQKMAKAIDDVMGSGRFAAMRLVRTESNYFANQGELQSYRDMGIEEYYFMGGGCDICQPLGGQCFRVDEARVGENMPPIHPNCKCTIRAKTRISEFLKRQGAEPLKEGIGYEEWKKRYVKGGLSATVGGRDGVEAHEEKKLLEVVDFDNKKLVQSKLKGYTDEIAGDKKRENAVCITRSGAVYRCFGTKDKVYPDFDLGDEFAGSYVTHNHPMSVTHFSFSDEDVSLFMEYRLPELVGTDQRYIYRIRRTKETQYADPETVTHLFYRGYFEELLQAEADGAIDPDADEYDFIVRKLAERYGFEYEREKRNKNL